jgi:hypothetical protein
MLFSALFIGASRAGNPSGDKRVLARHDLDHRWVCVNVDFDECAWAGVFAQAWTQCNSQSCRLHFDVPSGASSLYVIDGGALGVSIASSGNVFWGDTTGVHRHIPH